MLTLLAPRSRALWSRRDAGAERFVLNVVDTLNHEEDAVDTQGVHDHRACRAELQWVRRVLYGVGRVLWEPAHLFFG